MSDKNVEQDTDTDKNDEIEREIFGDQLLENDFGDEGYEIDPEELIAELNPDDNYKEEALSGAQKSISEQRYTTETPKVASGDIDADWKDSDTTGEEASLGANPTPDQDQISSVSEPWGTNYDTDKELDISKENKSLRHKRESDEYDGLSQK